MQAERPEKRPIGIVVDTDVGNHVDDALALALLYGLEGKEEVRVAALSVSKSNLKAAALCEVISRFYAGAVSGAFAAFRRPLPVGLSEAGFAPEDTPMINAVLGKQNAEGKAAYEHGIDKMTDTAEPRALIRNALTAQQDQNAVVVLTGPATSLASALTLPGFKDLVKRKVRFLCVSASKFNMDADPAAMRAVLADWPSEIVMAGEDLALVYPWSSIEKDFAWTENHPVADAYRAVVKPGQDASALDMATMLYAGRPEGNYFTLRQDSGERQKRLTASSEQKERIQAAFIELASAKPVVRQPRFRRPAAEEPKPPPPKPEAKKPDKD